MKHVLMLFTDQQRYDTIRALGNPVIQTPNLDALVRDSVVFTNAVTPCPICVPARQSLLAGQYPARTGCNTNKKLSHYQGKGFYSRFTEAGYQTCAVGKMHHIPDLYGMMGFETRHPQEELAHPDDEYSVYLHEKYPHVFDYHGMRSEMYYMPQISPLPPKDHPTHWIGDKSVEYIENCDPEKPMFLVSSYIHPHPPFCPPAPWQKLHREDPPAPFVPRPEDLEDYWELIRDRSCLKRLRISDQDLLRQKNFYYACISFVDYQVGRVIKALKDKGMYDDTLILFASDHGEMMGDHGTMGKRTMMDGSSRIPFIIHYPGQEPGVRTDPVSLVDVAPTLLSFAGIPYDPAEYDGIDLFGGEKHEYVYSQFNCADKGVYMMTDGRNKLIYNSETGRYFFFDTVPSEKNIYSEDNAKAQEMKVLLDAYRASDVCKQSNHEGDVYSKEHPHYVGRMEQNYYREEELAAIPEGYTLDLLK